MIVRHLSQASFSIVLMFLAVEQDVNLAWQSCSGLEKDVLQSGRTWLKDMIADDVVLTLLIRSMYVYVCENMRTHVVSLVTHTLVCNFP